MPTLARPETHAGTVLGTVGLHVAGAGLGRAAGLSGRTSSRSGSMLYEMSTGQKAFQRKTAAETMSAIIRDEPEPVAKLRPDLPLPVRWMLERCLAKDREERYASTKDLARDLASVRDHISEVSSGAEAMLAPTGRPGRPRIPRLALAVALGAALILAGWLAARASSSRPPVSPIVPAPDVPPGPARQCAFRPGRSDGRLRSGMARGCLGGYAALPDPPRQPRVASLRFSAATSSRSLPRTSSRSSGFRPRSACRDARNALPRSRCPAGRRGRCSKTSPTRAPISPRTAASSRSRTASRARHGWSSPRARCWFPSGVDGPRFSPDGSTIAFWDSSSDRISVGLVDRLGKSKKSLATDFVSFSGAACWRPDGKEIWVTASTGRASRMPSGASISPAGGVW